MLKLLTITLGALVGGCTLYTSCPKGQISNGSSCVAVSDGSAAGSGPVASGGGGNNPNEGGLAGSAPTEPWINATGSLVGIGTDFGNVCYVSAKPDEDELIAGLAGVGLWSSVDGGQNWQAMGTGKGSAALANRTSTLIFDPDHSDVFWDAGTYGPGIFKTTDAGHTFAQLGKTEHNEHLSVDLTDPKRRTLLAGGHEQGRLLWYSTDGGSSWTDIGMDLPADSSVCSFPMIIDAETFLVTCTQYNAPESGRGIFRSEDSGKSWTQVSAKSAWQAPLHASDDAIYWTVEGGGSLLKSTDQGVTWEQVFSGDLISLAPIELPSGSIVTATRDYLILSKDHGATWRPVSSKLPFSPVGIVYSSFQKAFFIWISSTKDEVPDEVIQRFDFDDSASR